MGGALSLYLGVAIIMCFEVLELCIDLFINICGYLKGGRKTKASLEEDELKKRPTSTMVFVK